MNKIWSTEHNSLPAATGALLFLGILSGYWTLAAILVLGAYILWLYYRLVRLEEWISQGTKTSKVYDDSGLVGTIIRHLYLQKKASNERKKRTKGILSRLNRNISALPDATVLLNHDLEIEWFNEPAHYLLAIESRLDLGQRITNLIRHPEFLRYLNAPEEQPYLEMASPRDSHITLQLRVVRFGKNQYLLSAQNVSDQKQLQEGLKNFVANASHELKSPLTVITGHLEMLEAEPQLSEPGRQSLQTAQGQAQRMNHLIDDLLILSQVESYNLRPNEGESVHIPSMMSSLIGARVIDDNQARIRVHTPQQLRLLGVKSEIEGICSNLIENALKYSAPDSPVIVDWTVDVLGEVILAVTDQGEGISAKELPHITRRYFRGAQNTTRQIAGSGLGLSIVKHSAHKHGARLETDSKPGCGSCFRVIFPSYRNLAKVSTPALTSE